MKILSLFLIIFILTGCSLKPKIALKPPETPKFENLENNTFTFKKNWWEYFNDANLNKIINNVNENLDLKIALQRIAQAEKLIKEKKSLLFPNISLETYRSKTKQHLHNLPPFIPSVIETRLYSGKVLSSYELDFWGKYRNLVDNAKRNLIIQKYSYDTIKKTLITNIALSYFKIITNKLLLKKINHSLNILKYEKGILEKRYSKGLEDISSIYQINIKLKKFESLKPSIEAAIKINKYILNYLCSKPPTINILTGEKLINIDKLKIPMNLPSDVLKRRPDVQIAIEKLYAQAHIIGSVKANIFPSFKLTGEYGFENENLRELIRNSSSLYSWVGKIFVNIFDYGAKFSRTNREERKLEELKYNYYKKILEVLKNVEISLINFHKLKEKYKKLLDEQIFYKKLEKLKIKNYERGITDVLSVLNIKLEILNLESEILNSHLEIIKSYIKSLKELGY